MTKYDEREFINKELSEFLKENKIVKLKTVKRKYLTRKPYGMTISICPECGSSLLTERSGIISCTGDKLQEWYNKFLEYESGNNEERLELLKEDKHNQFFQLYDRWCHKDASGNRTSFGCTYTNRMYSPIPSYEFFLYEVWQIKRMERSLKRRLTNAEREGMIKVRYKVNGIWKNEFVQKIKFPWGLL